MEVPGRMFFSNSISKYTINGQETTPEISPNSTTAKFWQYDARIGRRWNRDPIFLPALGPYTCFGLNPIYYSDKNGDIFKIGTGKQSKDDVTNMVRQQNRGYLKIDPKNGQVSLDFAGKSAKEIKKILSKDGGLNLINDLVNAQKTFYYGAEAYTPIVEKGTDNRAYLRFTGDHINAGDGSRSTVINVSKFGLNSSDKISEIPAIYDGVVIVDPSAAYTQFDVSGNQISLDRSNIVFHELAENYERTENSIDYVSKRSNNFLGAHALANRRENNSNFMLASNSPGSPASQTATFLTVATKQQIYSQMRMTLILTNISNGSAFDSEISEFIDVLKKRGFNVF